MSEPARPLDDAGRALYVHLFDDGGIFLVWGDGRSGWVTESRLEAELMHLRESGGRLIYSRDSLEGDPPPWVEATFQKIVDSKPAGIQLLSEPHPAAARHKASGHQWLGMSAYRGWKDMLTDLIRRGVPLDARGAGNGYTALILAVRGGSAEAAAMLLAAGADVNATDANGSTPLMHAALSGHEAIVRLLLAHGADRFLRGARGKTAADYARGQGHAGTVQLIETVG